MRCIPGQSSALKTGGSYKINDTVKEKNKNKWTEEPGVLQYLGSQRVRPDLETEQQQLDAVWGKKMQQISINVTGKPDPTVDSILMNICFELLIH